MKFVILFSLLLAPLAFAIPNPAAVYCQDMGYTLNYTTNASYCVFNDGNYCDEWAFYSGECGTEYRKELPCRNGGEPALVSECCEGMEKIPPTYIYNEDCTSIMTGWTSICSDCGNGNCETWENKCNCPEDCTQTINQCNCPKGTQCIIAESYPPQTVCSCTGPNCPVASNAQATVSYNLVTQTAVQVAKPNEQPVSHNISLWKTTSGNMGILQTVTATVGYTGKLAVEENGLFMETSDGKKPINIMPEAAVAVSETPTSFTKVELKEESQQPVYSVTGTQPARILFIIPISMEIKTKINAESGDVISVSKPWWSFLAW
ncbi:MAG: DUF333 domain-containing protein [Candidatus Aenigmarchaeota archaeon]|nr:DUF333 domain-containing protein [Candidatus Aenigmarchaeota archaeon]